MYEEYYNLTDNPFRLNPNPEFFYNSKTHKRAYSYLLYGIEQGEGFIVITGDVGSGKTTLVSRLIEYLKTENVELANIVTTQLKPEDLLRMVSAEYGLPYNRINKGNMLRNLEDYFHDCHAIGKRVLLIVDEAQNLSKSSLEELRMLSNLNKGGQSLFQSFLLGQKEFRQHMKSPGFEQLRQRIIATYHLRPLDCDETCKYIQHRLKVAGWKNDPTFEKNVFDDIFRFSHGIPRKINLLCNRILMYGCIEEIHNISIKEYKLVLNDIADEFWN